MTFRSRPRKANSATEAWRRKLMRMRKAQLVALLIRRDVGVARIQRLADTMAVRLALLDASSKGHGG